MCLCVSESMIIAEGKRKERARQAAHRTRQSRVTHNYRTPVAADTEQSWEKRVELCIAVSLLVALVVLLAVVLS